MSFRGCAIERPKPPLRRPRPFVAADEPARPLQGRGPLLAARAAVETSLGQSPHPRPGFRRRPPPPPADRRIRRDRSGPVGSDARPLTPAEPRRRTPRRRHAERPPRRDVRRRPHPRRHLLHDHGGRPPCSLRHGPRPSPPRGPADRRPRRLHRNIPPRPASNTRPSAAPTPNSPTSSTPPTSTPPTQPSSPHTSSSSTKTASYQVEVDHHVTGLFPIAAWQRLLTEAGFDVDRVDYPVSEDGRDMWLWVGKLVGDGS